MFGPSKKELRSAIEWAQNDADRANTGVNQLVALLLKISNKKLLDRRLVVSALPVVLTGIFNTKRVTVKKILEHIDP